MGAIQFKSPLIRTKTSTCTTTCITTSSRLSTASVPRPWRVKDSQTSFIPTKASTRQRQFTTWLSSPATSAPTKKSSCTTLRFISSKMCRSSWRPIPRETAKPTAAPIQDTHAALTNLTQDLRSTARMGSELSKMCENIISKTKSWIKISKWSLTARQMTKQRSTYQEVWQTGNEMMSIGLTRICRGIQVLITSPN